MKSLHFGKRLFPVVRSGLSVPHAVRADLFDQLMTVSAPECLVLKSESDLCDHSDRLTIEPQEGAKGYQVADMTPVKRAYPTAGHEPPSHVQTKETRVLLTKVSKNVAS